VTDLACVTAEDVVATDKLHEAHLVDHIAISRRWADKADAHLHCWERTDTDGTRLSDHPTVAIDVTAKASEAAREATAGALRAEP
jgi:hypothetical protein